MAKIFVVLIALLSLTAAADDSAIRKIDPVVAPIVQKYVDKGEFSGVVFVQDKTGVVHFNSYGLAVREFGVKNELNSIFRLGSLSKQFVAALIFHLQEQKKLKLDDSIGKFLATPPSWQGITIRNLLTHTSGLPDEFPIAVNDASAYHTPEELLASAKTIVPAPIGQHFLYSNMGYSLLAMTVAKVTGVDYSDYFEQDFGQTLNLANTRISHDAFIVPNLSFGYQHIVGDTDIRACCFDMTNLLGAGDVHSTVQDLSRWLDILLSGSFLHSESVAAMWSPQVPMENEGKVIDGLYYGYGWSIDKRQNRLVISHNGSVPGYVSDMAWFPREQARIIVLSNIRSIVKQNGVLQPEETASLIRFEIAHALFKE